MANENMGFWTSSRALYIGLGIVVAIALMLIFIPGARAATPEYGNTFDQNRTSGEVTIRLGDHRGNLDIRGQRRFRDTDCDLDRNGRRYGHTRLQGFQNQHCRRDNQGYYRGHQRRFTPTQWDVDGDGVPNRRDSYPNNPRRD